MSTVSVKGLQGSFLKEIICGEDDADTIVVTYKEMGDVMGTVFVYFYMYHDGYLSHGIGQVAFESMSEALSFVERLSEISAIDFMVQLMGVVPNFVSQEEYI